jgi:hypothetical protein
MICPIQLLEYPVGNSGNAYLVQRLDWICLPIPHTTAIDDFLRVIQSYLFANVHTLPSVLQAQFHSDTRSPVYHGHGSYLVVLNPFPTASSTLGRIDNTAFVAGGIVSGSVLNVNLTTQANNIGWTIEEDTPTINSDFTSDKRGFNISSDGSKLNFTCRGTAFITQTVSGNRTFKHVPLSLRPLQGERFSYQLTFKPELGSLLTIT